MATERQCNRSTERIQQLSESMLDSNSLRREVVEELRHAIGFDRWCWPVADPETLLPPDALFEHDYGAGLPRYLQLEYSDDPYAAKHLVAKARDPAASLFSATAGELSRSQRWDEVLGPAGIGDMAVVACRDQLGTWGWIEAYRDRGERPFDAHDLGLLRRVSRSLGSSLRVRAMQPVETAPERRPPGVIVLDSNLNAVSWTTGAKSWIHAMPAGDTYEARGMLPALIYPAAGVAKARPSSPARVLTQVGDGDWMAVEVALLQGAHDGGLVVTMRAATGDETFGLLCRAYGLTRRERQLVALIVEGRDTKSISVYLSISRHTVQEHVTSVFEKTGVRSRRQLMALLARSTVGDSDWASAGR